MNTDITAAYFNDFTTVFTTALTAQEATRRSSASCVNARPPLYYIYSYTCIIRIYIDRERESERQATRRSSASCVNAPPTLYYIYTYECATTYVLYIYNVYMHTYIHIYVYVCYQA